MTRNKATAIGCVTIAFWSLLAVLSVLAIPVPPFLLNALSFGIGGIAGLIWIAVAGRFHLLRGIPLSAILFGTAGLFGYHALYFFAMRMAPPAEAGLVNYLWPLLIVLFSGLLPGERLRRGHLIGAGLAFVGVAVIILGKGSSELSGRAVIGLALALLAAFVWATYSTGSRRMAAVPTEAVAIYCVLTALLSVVCHLLWEDTLWPLSSGGWIAIVVMGLGPVGLAFYTWDVGMKHGNIQLLGVISYAAPLFSTLALVIGGAASLTPSIGLAALLITIGAAIAARAGR